MKCKECNYWNDGYCDELETHTPAEWEDCRVGEPKQMDEHQRLVDAVVDFLDEYSPNETGDLPMILKRLTQELKESKELPCVGCQTKLQVGPRCPYNNGEPCHPQQP